MSTLAVSVDGDFQRSSEAFKHRFEAAIVSGSQIIAFNSNGRRRAGHNTPKQPPTTPFSSAL